MLQNSETENLGFVRVETFTRVYFFKRTISPAYGYSIEAFRGKYYLGSISVEGGSGASTVQNQIKALKLQNNDTLIWVSLIPRQLNMVVQLTTKENNSPVCRLTIVLKVDPGRTRDFATLFNQCTGPNNDPVVMAKAPIAHALQKYVRLRSYDELDNDEMHYRVLNSLLGDNKKYGLIVDSIDYLAVVPDEHITQQIKINQQVTIERTQITEDSQTNQLRDRVDQDRASLKNEFKRGEDAWQNQYQRKEQDLDDQRRRRKEFHDALGLTTQQGLANKLQKELNADKSIYEILQQNPDMINMDTLYNPPSTEQPAGQIGWQERAMHELERRTIDGYIGEGDNELEIVPLSAIARAVLEENNMAFVGKTYIVQAGISRSTPQSFLGEAFDLLMSNAEDSFAFDILLHASENIKFVEEWHKHLVYKLYSMEPQTVEFTFQTTAPGRSFLLVDFYREFCWVKTVRLQFDASENLFPTS